MVDRTGVQPTRVGALPPAVRGAQPHVPERRRADGARRRWRATASTSTRPRCSTRTRRPRSTSTTIRRGLRRADRPRTATRCPRRERLLDLLVVGDVERRPRPARRRPRAARSASASSWSTTASLVLGGSGAIVAAGAARLGPRVAMAGCVGDDVLGRAMLRGAGHGVDVSAVRPWTEPTGITVGLVRDGRPGDPDRAGSAGVVHAPTTSRTSLLTEARLGPRHVPVPAAGARRRRDRRASRGHDLARPGLGPPRALGVGVGGLRRAPSQRAGGRAARSERARGGGEAGRGGRAVRGSPRRGAARRSGRRHRRGRLVRRRASSPRGSRGEDLAAALALGCACGALSTRAAGGTAGQPTLAEARTFSA